MIFSSRQLNLIQSKKSDILNSVTFKNIDIINNHTSNNERVVFLTSHQCNWEWLLLSLELNLNKRMHAVYKKLSNKKLNDLLFKSRSRFGTIMVESKELILKLRSDIT